MGEPYTVCPSCRERVEPNHRATVYAVEQVDVPGFGQAHDWIDGRSGYFHANCPPERIRYARRPRPILSEHRVNNA